MKPVDERGVIYANIDAYMLITANDEKAKATRHTPPHQGIKLVRWSHSVASRTPKPFP